MADGGSDYLGLIGLLAAAGITSAGSIYNNRQQRKLQESVNSEAINLANTAHQREVADLRAAGLNPILSATGSGAATPSLGTAQLDNVFDSFGSNARGIGEMISKRRSLENELVDSQIEKTDADAAASVATASNLRAQNNNLRVQNQELLARVENIDADTELKKLQLELLPYKGHITSEIPGFKHALEQGFGALTDLGSSAATFGRSAYDSYDNLIKKLQEMKARGVENSKSFEKSPSGPGRLDRLIKKAFTPSDRKIPPRSSWYWIDSKGNKHYYFNKK